MLRFNKCPKCKGNIMLDKDQYGWYEQCLQCGYLHDMDIQATSKPVSTVYEEIRKPALMKGYRKHRGKKRIAKPQMYRYVPN